MKLDFTIPRPTDGWGPDDEYHAVNAINNGCMSAMLKSPMHFISALNGPHKAATEAMNFGSAVHMRLLEADKFDTYFHKYDLSQRPEPTRTMATKANKAWALEQAELMQSGGKKPITTDQLEAIERIEENCHNDPFIRDLLRLNDSAEEAKFWTDEETGLPCKGKKDGGVGDLLFDIKTCRDASLDAFQRDMVIRHYYRSMTWYMDAFKAKTGYFIVIENVAPFGVTYYKCSEEMLEFGRDEYRRILGMIKACNDLGEWPGYSYNRPMSGIEIDLPVWKYRNAE